MFFIPFSTVQFYLLFLSFQLQCSPHGSPPHREPCLACLRGCRPGGCPGIDGWGSYFTALSPWCGPLSVWDGVASVAASPCSRGLAWLPVWTAPIGWCFLTWSISAQPYSILFLFISRVVGGTWVCVCVCVCVCVFL